MHRHGRAQGHGPFGLQVFGKRGGIGDRARICLCVAVGLASRGPGCLGLVFGADQTGMKRHLPCGPGRNHARPGEIFRAIGFLQIALLILQSIHALVKGVIGVIGQTLVLHLALQGLQLGCDLLKARLGCRVRLDRTGIDTAVVRHHRIVVAQNRLGPGKAQFCTLFLGRFLEFFDQDRLNKCGIFQHRMLVQKIGRDRSTARLIVFAHEGADIIADLHPTRFKRLSDRIGLQVVVLTGQRLEDVLLNLLARMVGKGLHRIERDGLGPRRRANVGMDEPIAQPAFHRGNRCPEGLGNGLRRLAINLHHPGESLELVNGPHRCLGDVFCKRQGRGNIAVLGHEAALHLGFGREPFGGFVRHQLLQCRAAAPPGKNGVFALDLLNQQRLQQAQHRDAGLEMGDVVRIIGFRRIAPHIGGVGGKIANGNGNGFETCSHRISFSGECVAVHAFTRATNPRLRGSPRQKARIPFGGSAGLEFERWDLGTRLRYQSRAIMIVSTRRVVSGFSGVSAP